VYTWNLWEGFIRESWDILFYKYYRLIDIKWSDEKPFFEWEIKWGIKRERPIIVEDDHGGELDLIRTKFGHHEQGISELNNGIFGTVLLWF
jgi:hypothetical protein